MAYVYSEDDDCIKKMVSERIALVKSSYSDKTNYLSSRAKNSNGEPCNYANINSKVNGLNIDNLDSYSDDINNLNEQLIWQGCPALF